MARLIQYSEEGFSASKIGVDYHWTQWMAQHWKYSRRSWKNAFRDDGNEGLFLGKSVVVVVLSCKLLSTCYNLSLIAVKGPQRAVLTWIPRRWCPPLLSCPVTALKAFERFPYRSRCRLERKEILFCSNWCSIKTEALWNDGRHQ